MNNIITVDFRYKNSYSKICELEYFRDGETKFIINEPVAGKDIDIIFSMQPPINNNIINLVMILDAFRRSYVNSIKLTITYFAYLRQDRTMNLQTSLSSKCIADIISKFVDSIEIIDPHFKSIETLFDVPVKVTYMYNKYMELFSKYDVIVSPDAGGNAKVYKICELLGKESSNIDKVRPKPGESKIVKITGNVKEKSCIILDDIIDSAGTLCNASEMIMNTGATCVSAFATHGLFSGDAFDRINKSPMQELFVTDSIPIVNIGSDKLKVLNVF